MIFFAFKEKLALGLMVVLLLLTVYYTTNALEDYNDAVQAKYAKELEERDSSAALYERNCMTKVDKIEDLSLNTNCAEWRSKSFHVSDAALWDKADRAVSRGEFRRMTPRSILNTGFVCGGIFVALALFLLARIWDLQRMHNDRCHTLPSGPGGKAKYS